MAMFISYKPIDTETSLGFKLDQLHVGQADYAKQIWFLDVASVQADGHELDQACEILGFNTKRRVYTFVGDQARTIIANWK